MLLGKKRKLGRTIEEITEGEKLTLTEQIEDKDLLIYLGLTNDANPLFIQHDYASQTPYRKPVVPSIMLTGIVTAAVSKYLPGPGSYIQKQEFEFHKPVYHYATIQYLLEVTEVDADRHTISMKVTAEDEEEDLILSGSLIVCPPIPHEPMEGKTLDNF